MNECVSDSRCASNPVLSKPLGVKQCYRQSRSFSQCLLMLMSVACKYLNLHKGLRHLFLDTAQNKEFMLQVISVTSLTTIDERQQQLLVLNINTLKDSPKIS